VSDRIEKDADAVFAQIWAECQGGPRRYDPFYTQLVVATIKDPELVAWWHWDE
jgi:hypothetical protein